MIRGHGPARAGEDAGVPQPPSRQHAVGSVRGPRRRHLRHDRVQGGHDVDAAHPRGAGVRAGAAPARPLHELSPWIDARFMGPIEPMLDAVEAQRHRRFIKSHLAADGLRFFPRGEVHRRRTRHARRVHVAVQPLLRVHRLHVHAVQRRRPPRARVPALPADTARAVAALDQRRLVRLGARRLAVLVASPSPLHLVGGPRPAQRACSCTSAT